MLTADFSGDTIRPGTVVTLRENADMISCDAGAGAVTKAAVSRLLTATRAGPTLWAKSACVVTKGKRLFAKAVNIATLKTTQCRPRATIVSF